MKALTALAAALFRRDIALGPRNEGSGTLRMALTRSIASGSSAAPTSCRPSGTLACALAVLIIASGCAGACGKDEYRSVTSAPTKEEKLLTHLDSVAGVGPRPAATPLVESAIAAALWPGELAVTDGVFVADDGGATFTWRVPARYETSWDAWTGIRTVPVDEPTPHEETIDGYNPSFVHPVRWPVRLDGCATESPDGGDLSFSWTLRRDEVLVAQFLDYACSVDFEVPDEGVYQVTMAVSSDAGWQDGITANIDVEDILIVSLGDSSASGEGNPDGDRWADRRCHRSHTSGPALAAKSLENGSQTSSVTFLSFACSGAAMRSGILREYEGGDPIEPDPSIDSTAWNTLDLVAQVQAAREALCAVPVRRCGPDDMRQPDYILVAIGVNDLGFAKVVEACAKLSLDLSWLPGLSLAAAAALGPVGLVFLALQELSSGPCDEDVNLESAVLNTLPGLDTTFEPLAEKTFSCDDRPDAPYCFDGHDTFGELRRQLVATGIAPEKGVYLSTYPAEPLSGTDGEIHGGCGVLREIDEGEARWFSEIGYQLNELIHREAIRNGFYSVPGITEAFRGHGYCAGKLLHVPVEGFRVPIMVGSDSYFVGLTQSLIEQGDIEGALHPNLRGHQAIRDALLRAMASEKPDRAATHRVTVLLQQLRFDVPSFAEIKATVEVATTPYERIGNSEIAEGLEPVWWKRVSNKVELDVVPGVEISDFTQVMQVDMSPADSELEFWVYATVRSRNPLALRAAPHSPVEISPTGEVVAPGDPPNGAVGFYWVRPKFPRTDDMHNYGRGAYSVQSQLNAGNPGAMHVDFCIIVTPLRGSILLNPNASAEISCHSDVVSESK
jgi:hypothetical protein